SVHRGELQMLLLDVVRERCGPDAVVEGHRLLGYEQDASSITASFEDRASGRTVRVDGSLLIGADGLHSSARRQRFPDEGEPVWGGAVL
ncbi:flavin-dependent oxidoreductase, partial [bacterium LRH843]|nr:flavin-dependent oxidoreductase [bacterium LRH843]